MNGLTLANGAAFLFALDRAGAGQGAGFHSQVAVLGTIDVGGATLNPTLDYIPANGDALIIVNNDNVDAVNRLFKDALGNIFGEGFTLSLNGYGLQISYFGGSGNDVVLTFQPVLEPGVFLLCGAALLSVGLRRIRRRLPPRSSSNANRPAWNARERSGCTFPAIRNWTSPMAPSRTMRRRYVHVAILIRVTTWNPDIK